MDTLRLLLTYLLGFIREHATRARRTATVGSISAETIVVAVALIGVAVLVTGAIYAFATGKIGELGA